MQTKTTNSTGNQCRQKQQQNKEKKT